MITIDDFKKVEMKIGQVLLAEKIEGSDKLLKLSVDFAEETPRQVLSGIASYFPNPKDLVGKRCAFVTNLPPRVMMGLDSQAMILAAGVGGSIAFFEVPDSILIGTLVR